MNKNPRVLKHLFRKIDRGNKSFKTAFIGLLGTFLGIYYYLQITHIFEPVALTEFQFLNLLAPSVIILGLMCLFTGLGVFKPKYRLPNR